MAPEGLGSPNFQIRRQGCEPYTPIAFTPPPQVIHLLKRPSRPQDHSAAPKIKSMKNPNNTIGNRNHDLPAFSAVPQPTSPPQTPDKDIQFDISIKTIIVLFFLNFTEVQIFVCVKLIESILQSSHSLHVLIVDLQAIFYIRYAKLKIIYMRVKFNINVPNTAVVTGLKPKG